MFSPWHGAQRQGRFAFSDMKQAQHSVTGAFLNVNTAARQRKSPLDGNKHRPTKVADSLSLSRHRLTTGARASSPPATCRDRVSQSQQRVHPGSPGTDAQGQYPDAHGGDTPLRVRAPWGRGVSQRPGVVTGRTDCGSKDARHVIQAKNPASFQTTTSHQTGYENIFWPIPKTNQTCK